MLAVEKLMRPVASHVTGRPPCPNCGRSTHLARTTPGTGGQPNVRTYGCGECGVWLTEAAGDVATD